MITHVPFAMNHLRWLVPPDHQADVLLSATNARQDVMKLVEANEDYCGTIMDEDGLPILCSGVYEYETHGLAWTFFHEDMKDTMKASVRIVRSYLRKFLDLTGKPVYVTVDETVEDAVRWVKLIGFAPVEGQEGIWWVQK